MVKIFENGYEAWIDETQGGNCIRLRHHPSGAVILREPPLNGKKDNPYLYGMPILFPCNRISGGSFHFKGQSYQFPINEPKTGCHLHGVLHEMPFTIIQQEKGLVSLRFDAGRTRPYLGFCQEFSISITYTLEPCGLLQSTVIRNHSKCAMPVLLGFHTTFAMPVFPQSNPQSYRVMVEVEEEYERNPENHLPTGKTLPFDAVTQELQDGTYVPYGHGISRHYRSPGCGKMEIIHSQLQKKVVYETDEKYQYRLIYNGDGHAFICLEPQTCIADCFHVDIPLEKRGIPVLSCGEEQQYIMRISIQDFESDNRMNL